MNTEVKEPKITLKPVKSSQIFAVGHCADTNTLAIQFRSKAGLGSVYYYKNFTADDFAKFERAESIGSHFGAHIKDAKHDDGTLKFPFTKMANPTQPAVQQAA